MTTVGGGIIPDTAPEGHWCLRFEHFDPEDEGRREALCTLANGYLSVRGAVPESAADGVHYPGTYVAGVYNRLEDDVHGRAVTNESLVNLPNWLLLRFRVAEGDWFHLDDAEVVDHVVELDTHRAVLRRHLRFRDGEGRVTRVDQRRFVHLDEHHLGALVTTFTAENWAGNLAVRSGIDGRVTNDNVERYRSLSSTHLLPVDEAAVDDETLLVEVVTTQSHVRVGVAARTRVLDGGGASVDVPRSLVHEPAFLAHDLALALEQGRPVEVEKVVAVFTSRDHAVSEAGIDAVRAVQGAADAATLERRHAVHWAHVWQRGDIEIEIDDGDEQPRPEIALRVNLFHLLQTVTKNSADLDVGVPARGLHGEAYRGHIFWDELFIFPYLNLRFPKLTRGLLLYRYRRLAEARRAAAAAGYRGAMFPWQSGSNGEEETQTWHLNPNSGRWLPDGSHLQRHVNIAVAYNVWQYYDATHNYEFLSFYGAELLLEIARFWASAAVRDPADGRYDIDGVVGPDEYHEAYPGADQPGLRNNAYTNVMAAWVLDKAVALGSVLTEHRTAELHEKLGIDDEELAAWEDISRRLRVPFHDGVISQFEGYGELAELDWDAYRERYGEIRRLDRLLEAEGDTPNAYKLSKQADVLMLLYLLSADEVIALLGRLGYEVDHDVLRATTDYYLARTSNGSSLSGVVHTWLMVHAGLEPSWPLFAEAMESDLRGGDGGTVREGIHLGAMAGTADLVQRGYGGVAPRDGVLWIEPALPPEITRLCFNVGYRGASVTVALEDGQGSVRAHPNAGPVTVGLGGEVVELAPCEERRFPVPRRRATVGDVADGG